MPRSRCLRFVLLFGLFLSFLVTMPAFAAPVSQTPNCKEHSTDCGTIAADPWNDRLAVQVGADGRFNIGAFPDANGGAISGTSWDLSFRWPAAPWSSYTTFRIDQSDVVYGSAQMQALVPPTDNSDHSRNESSWRFDPDIEVQQIIELVFNPQTNQRDLAKITYTVHNTGTVPHRVGARVLIDTELNGNDGAPFRVPGDSNGIITHEREFPTNAVPDVFYSFFNPNDATHVAAGILKGYDATPRTVWC